MTLFEKIPNSLKARDHFNIFQLYMGGASADEGAWSSSERHRWNLESYWVHTCLRLGVPFGWSYPTIFITCFCSARISFDLGSIFFEISWDILRYLEIFLSWAAPWPVARFYRRMWRKVYALVIAVTKACCFLHFINFIRRKQTQIWSFEITVLWLGSFLSLSDFSDILVVARWRSSRSNMIK